MLGDSFPKEFLDEFIEKKELSVGDVLYLHCDFTTPEKNKFMVVACCEPLLVLLINSNINQFISSREELLDCQVKISQSEHDFLDWDSFVNCVDAHAAFELDVVKEQLSLNYMEVYRGRVVDNCMSEIKRAVNSSPTMIRKHKRAIITELERY